MDEEGLIKNTEILINQRAGLINDKAGLINKLKDERGSLSILSTSLFFILVITSFIILNTSSAFLAKRELIQISELAITRATHNLDSGSYYNSTNNGVVPIDCAAAYQSFTTEISQTYLRENPIGFTGWTCDGFTANATVTSQVKHLLSMPLLASDSPVLVSANVAAQNRLR